MARRTSRRDDEIVRVSEAEYSGSRRSAHLPEDENPYKFRVQKGELKTGEESRKKYIEWVLMVESGEFKGKRIYHTTSLQEKALFNLRGMMEACGVTVRDMRASQIIKTLTNKTFTGNVMDDEYDGKVKSVLDDYVIGDQDEAEDDEDDEEEEETPRRRKGASRTSQRSKGRSRRSRDDEDEDEEEEEDDEEEDDEEEEEEDEEDEDEDEDDEEEEEEPAPKRRGKSKAAAPAGRSRTSRGSKRSKRSTDDEDLDEIDLDDL